MNKSAQMLAAAIGFTFCLLGASQSAAMELPPVVRGSGTVILAPDEGSLTMTFSKRDLNIYDGADIMTVSVRDPLGEEVISVTLPDDGDTGKGPHAKTLQQETRTIESTRPGLYRVVFSGGDYMFGMSADCDRYVVKAGMMFNDSNTAGQVYFAPPEGAFEVKAAALHNPGVQAITLHDASGTVLKQYDLQEPGEDVQFDAGEDTGDRGGLWHFDIGKMDVRLAVEGVQHWTMAPDAYFDAAGTHLALAPRNCARYLQPGEAGQFRIVVARPEGYTGDFDVSLDQPANDGIEFALADTPARTPDYANDRVIVRVRATVDDTCKPGRISDAYTVVKAAGRPLAAAGSHLQVRIDPSPVSRHLDMPIVLEPYKHENWQYGYAPEYPPNEVYFDRDNSPWIRHRTEHRHHSAGAVVLEDDRWVLREWADPIKVRFPDYVRPSSGSGFHACRWAFDDDGGAWTVMRLFRSGPEFNNVILYTPDRGRTWQVEPVAGGLAEIEAFTGHNRQSKYPPVLAYKKLADHPARFCSYQELLLYTPRIEDGKLVVPEPLTVSDDCLGGAQHSGPPPTLATRAGKTHIVWGEVTDPDDPGVPSYIATYDHDTGELSEKIFLGYAPPVNDVHNIPAVVLDSEGYIHVVTGSHGDTFMYRRSLEPNDVSQGFTEAVKVLDGGFVDSDTDEDGEGRQTYIGLVCDPDDTLHIAYRQWRKGVDEYRPNFTYYGALSYQSKPKGEPWSDARPLIIPPVGGYSIYYHKLSIDRTGRLYLAHSYLTSHAYQEDFPGLHDSAALLVSKDAGKTWKLAQTQDFISGVQKMRDR
ncbi:MAG: BNR-4 repeat-containing protein [Armatimonadota bacterium]